MKNKVIIFDFFGVICSNVSKLWFDKYFPDWSLDSRNECCRATDLGVISEDAFFQTLGLLIHAEPKLIRSQWMEYATINKQLVSEIHRLKNTHRIVLASNSPTPLITEILENNKLFELFDDIIISAEINKVKPDKEFFEYVLDRINTNPENITFFDDNQDNIESAKKLGIRSILFSSVNDIQSII